MDVAVAKYVLLFYDFTADLPCFVQMNRFAINTANIQRKMAVTIQKERISIDVIKKMEKIFTFGH